MYCGMCGFMSRPKLFKILIFHLLDFDNLIDYVISYLLHQQQLELDQLF